MYNMIVKTHVPGYPKYLEVVELAVTQQTLAWSEAIINKAGYKS